MFKAIIFDAEGVIINSEEIWDMEQKVFLEKRGINYNRSKLKPLLTGLSIIDGVKLMKKIYRIEEDTLSLANERIECIKNLFTNNIDFIPGFMDYYNNVRMNFKTCVATSMNRDLLNYVDKKLKLNELFDNNIFSIDDIGGKSKPDPAIFLYSAKQLGVKSKECIVIEDAPKGIEGAKSAGMQCIAITTTYPKEKLAKADKVVSGFAEIGKINLK